MGVKDSKIGGRAEVVVVGAGPAGAHVSRVLVNRGFSVRLLEQHSKGRDKPCGGLIDLKVWDLLGSARKNLTAWPIKGTMVFSPGSNNIHLKSENIRSYAVFRSEFDALLADLAEESGAVLHENARVNRIIYNDANVKILCRNAQSIPAEMVVGADGTYSTVARASGLRTEVGHDELVFCLVSEFEYGQKKLEEEVFDINTIEIYMLGGLGYGWVIPKGDYVNIGCGRAYEHLDSAKGLWDKFLSTLHSHNRFVDIPIPRPKGYYYRSLKGPKVQTFTDRTILLGDAAGFANNLSGEGIWPAVQSAELAVPVIVRAWAQDSFDGMVLADYEKAWRERFGPEFDRKQNLLQLVTKMSLMRKSFVGRFIGARSWSEAKTFDQMLDFIKSNKDLHSMINEVYQHRSSAKVVLPKIKRKIPGLALDYFGKSFQKMVNGKQMNPK